jgi:hypothetical protein
VILDVTLVGTVGGEEKELGTQQDTFNAAPGAPHLTELSIQPDATFTGVRFDTIELRTWIHGVSAGQGVVKTNGDASSFISVPTAGISVINPPTKPTPPGKNSPPGKGKKKGCGKGKGKQNGACPKPGASACVPYVPGEEGKEAKTTVVTDAATAEKPVEVDLTAGAGGGAMPLSGTPVPYDETSSLFQNVQVDSQSPSTGLYARFEFADHHDYDFYLNYPDGSTAANSGDFNIAPGAGAGGGSPDGAWEAGSNYEQVMGIETADCAGYTARMVSYLTTGGDVKLKLWLGDVVAPPVPAGESQAAAADADALTNFYGLTGLANPSAPRMASAMSTPASNKGCTKGKGQKNGCKKSPVACKAFAPGERGADKPTLVATDAATEEAPLEQKITLAESVADLDLTGEIPDEGPLAASVEFFNVQVDTTSATTGLYMLFEFDERRDYDMDLLHVDGSYAARSHGFNTICGAPQPNCTNDGHGGEPTSNSEKLVGISTSDCGGWTTELTNWLGEGGEMTVKVWLGEVANEPLAPGEEPHA